MTKDSCGLTVAPGGMGISPASCLADGSVDPALSLPEAKSTLAQAIRVDEAQRRISDLKVFMVAGVKAAAHTGVSGCSLGSSFR
jgi:hypothetical protein